MRSLAVCALAVLLSVTLVAGETDQREADKVALKPVNGYVGGWKGTGSTKESSGRDAWQEEFDWSWEFKDNRAILVYEAPKGRYLTGGKLMPSEKAGEFVFMGTPAGQKSQDEYRGSINKEGELVLDAVKPEANKPARLSFALVARGKRLVMGYQKMVKKDRYETLAEVGLTLKGSGFGKFDDPRECVVTGGTGTISVSYQGQTYYVCCSGCKKAFDENPAKEIAAFKKRKEDEKKARQ